RHRAHTMVTESLDPLPLSTQKPPSSPLWSPPMNTSPEDSARERAELKDSEEHPKTAERGKFTVTVAVAFVLVPATVAGLGWFLYDGGSASELTSTEADPEEA